MVKEPESPASKLLSDRNDSIVGCDGKAGDGDGSRGGRSAGGPILRRGVLLARQGLLEHGGRRRGRYLLPHGGSVAMSY